MNSAEVIWALGLSAAGLSGAGGVAAPLGRRKIARGVGYLAATTACLGLTAASHMDVAPPKLKEGGPVRVYLQRHEPPLVEALAHRYAGRDVTVVGLGSAGSMVRRHFPAARFEPLDDPDVGRVGAVTEAALRDLTRLARAGADGPGFEKVVLVAPRYVDGLATVNHLWNALRVEHPGLADRVEWLTSDDLGVPTPVVTLDAPVLTSPDQRELKLRLLVRGAPPGSTVVVRQFGPKAGTADDVLAVLTLGEVGPSRVGPGGTPIRPARPEYAAQGAGVPIARDGATVAVECSLLNEAGEVVGFARIGTTTLVHPVGLLDPDGAKRPTALRSLVANLGLPYEDVRLDLTPSAGPVLNAGRLARWGVLFVHRRLDAGQGEALRRALAASANPPAVVFVGVGDPEPNDAGSGVPAGWDVLCRRLIPLGSPPRKIIFDFDPSPSMQAKTPDGSMTKIAWAEALFQALKANLDQRRPVIVRENNGLELADFLVTSDKASRDDPAKLDFVYVFDPDDVRNGAELDEDARKAAEEMTKRGVRLWLISAGRETFEKDLGRVVKDSVIADFKQGASLPQIQRTLFLRMFPRFAVKPGAVGKLLPEPSLARRLEEFLGKKDVRIGVPFSGWAEPGKHADDARTVLWSVHDVNGHVSPLLLKDEADLGGGKRSAVYQLCVDLQSEAGRVVTGVDAPADVSDARNTLSGLLVRVIAACATEPYKPTIYWSSRQDGLVFFLNDYRPFQIEPTAGPADPRSPRGLGVGATLAAGLGAGRPLRVEVDDRRLDQIAVRVALARAEAGQAPPVSAVTYVVEDRRPEVGRAEVTLPQTPNPPRFLLPKEIPAGASTTATAAPATPPTAPRHAIEPGWLRMILAGAWAALAVFVLRNA